jgi:murein DD-endopeptidase MepM/ murein hydrolase activator NlpD
VKFAKLKDGLKRTFNREAVKRFVNRQGFYIILFICICVITATALWTSGNIGIGIPSKEEERNAVENHESHGQEDIDEEVAKETDAGRDADKVDIKIRDVVEAPADQEGDDSKEKAREDNVQDTKDKDSPKTVQTAEKDEKSVQAGTSDKRFVKANVAPVASSNAAKSRIKMQKPVQGKIYKDFVMDSLVYSRTLKEWTTHDGIDFECQLGSEVKAALGGTVESVDEDPLMGIVITIDHGNGLKTRYANLSTKDMVAVSQKVEQGQVISGVGRTASFEILDPPHLHFQVLRDGKAVDPKEYLE